MQISRNHVKDGEWLLAKIEDFSLCSNFDCGNNDLNDFITNDASKHKTELLAETYSLKMATADNVLVAFISFCNDAIQLTKDVSIKILPPEKQYLYKPAVKIARLGVQRQFQGQDIGTHLINMSKQLFLYDNRTGCRFMTVDAYNDAPVTRFYGKNGFSFLSDKDSKKKTRIMYFDLKRLLQAPSQ